jgi:DNA repair protein RadC
MIFNRLKSTIGALNSSRFLTDVVAEGTDELTYKEALRSAEAAFQLFRQVLTDRPTEEFWTILLDGKHRVLGLAQTSVGTLTSSLVHPREVFGPAIRMNAAAVIVGHNHPSGDPEPSPEDLEVTRRLVDAGKLLGIPLVDHLVCGGETYVSLRDRMGFA